MAYGGTLGGRVIGDMTPTTLFTTGLCGVVWSQGALSSRFFLVGDGEAIDCFEEC